MQRWCNDDAKVKVFLVFWFYFESMERWRWNVVFSTHSSQHSRVCVFSHICKPSQYLHSPILLLLSFRWRDGKQYFLVSNRRRFTNHTRKYFFTFFLRAKKSISGWNTFFRPPMTQKFTKNFVNFYLSIADFEVCPKKKSILSYISPSALGEEKIQKSVS